MSLQGKTAIVTGSSSGIGRAIALEMARQGASVTINYHRGADEADEVRTGIEGAGGRAQVIQADVSSVADIAKLVDGTVAAFGRVDIMVNNAGIETRTSTLETSDRASTSLSTMPASRHAPRRSRRPSASSTPSSQSI